MSHKIAAGGVFGALQRNLCPLLIPVLPLPGVFSVSITLTLQVGDLAVLLLLQLGKLLAVGLEALAVLQFQAVVLQLQVQQLLLDIVVLVLGRRRRDRVSTRGVI